MCCAPGGQPAPWAASGGPASFRWGHVRQLDRVSRELLWAAGAGPSDAPFTIALIRRSARPTDWPPRHHGYTSGAITRSGHCRRNRRRADGCVTAPRPRRRPLPAGNAGAPAGPGDNSRCGPSGFAWSPSAASWTFLHHHPPAAQSHRDTRRCLGHWMDGAADGPRSPTPPSQSEPTPRRYGSSPEAHARFPTGPLRHLRSVELEADHRRHAEIENAPRPEVRRRTQPSPLGPLRRQRRLAGGPGDGPQPGPLDSPHGSRPPPRRQRVFALAGRIGTPAHPSIFPRAWQEKVSLARLRAIPLPTSAPVLPLTRHQAN